MNMQADISGYPLRKRSLDYGDPLPNVTVMLGRISLQTLQKAAVYGAVLSVAGSSILYYLTQRNLSSGPYFTEAVAALKRDKKVCYLLGEPVRIKALRLGDKENQISPYHAHVLIPVSGSRTSGVLKSNASVRNGKWELDSVTLQLSHRPEEIEIIHKCIKVTE